MSTDQTLTDAQLERLYANSPECQRDTTSRRAFKRVARTVLAGTQPQQMAPAQFDLLAHLRRQASFSERTFGPGQRIEGLCDHIHKELKEVRESGGDLKEWIDVIILALDGAWRSGASPQQIIDALVAKQTTNEGRVWPDWRTAEPGKAIEHDRSRDAAAATSVQEPST